MRVCVSVCVYAHMYIYIHVYTHCMYIYIYTLRSFILLALHTGVADDNRSVVLSMFFSTLSGATSLPRTTSGCAAVSRC